MVLLARPVLLAALRRGLSLQDPKKMSIVCSRRTMTTIPTKPNSHRLPDFFNPEKNGNGPALSSIFVMNFRVLAVPFYWEFIRPNFQDGNY